MTTFDESVKTILSLCDLSGVWSQPYIDAGYNVIRMDISRSADEDIRLIPYQGKVHGILCAPPCTEFAGSGARWWKEKEKNDPDYLTDALALVDACMRQVAISRPIWWALENPVGRLKDWLGPYQLIFQPWEYAMLADSPDEESYTKKTCIWGDFNLPAKAEHPKEGTIHKSKMHLLPPGPNRKNLRSKTPQGFARAFFQANP